MGVLHGLRLAATMGLAGCAADGQLPASPASPLVNLTHDRRACDDD